MPAGPLIIVEEKAYCDGKHSLEISHDRPGVRNLNDYRTIKIRLSKDGCMLEFRWPYSPVEDASYRQTMQSNIMVGTTDREMEVLGTALDGKLP
jgi:hypothetical protein